MCNRLRRPRWLGLLFATHFKVGRASRLFSGILHAGLLFSAHFLIADVPVFIAIPLIFCFLSAVVIVCTFLRFTAAFPAYPPQQTKKMLGCYPQHNSMYSVSHSVSKLRIRHQPRQIQLGRQNPHRAPPPQTNSHPPRCYPAHISKILKILSNFLRPLSHSKNIFCGNLCCE